ncbi:MAG: hypothetical protein E7239_12275 [Sarcina sp.]|nr:hypothetical protein [Sarcina sp.]MBE6002127.1 hypothetical protein [Sarcina sp.]
MTKRTIPSDTVNMSTECPFCGRMFTYTLYPEIHIPGDNRLKKKVLNKTLFFPKCPHCGEEIKLKPVCIYHDENRRVLFIVTDSPDTALENMIKSGNIHFNDIRTDDDVMGFMKGLYVRRVVHDVDAFREKILLSDCNYDDRIIELIKLSLSRILEKEKHMPVYRIFLEDTSGSMLEFTAIMGSRPPYEYITVTSAANIYNQYRDKYLHKLGRPEEDEYIMTDQKWAVNAGLLKDGPAGVVIPVD